MKTFTRRKLLSFLPCALVFPLVRKAKLVRKAEDEGFEAFLTMRDKGLEVTWERNLCVDGNYYTVVEVANYTGKEWVQRLIARKPTTQEALVEALSLCKEYDW